MGFEVIFLVLAVLVIAFGIGVLVVNRRRESRGEAPRTRTVQPGTPPPRPDGGGGTATLEAPPAPEAPVVEEAVVEGAVVEGAVVEEVPPATLRDRLAKARSTFAAAITGVLGRSGITEESFEDLEEALLRADVGVGITGELLDGLRERVTTKEITEPEQLLDALQAEMAGRLHGADRSLHFEERGAGEPNVWMFVGVNGVGKTTTIGKLSKHQVDAGRRVLLAAGDTFRAAAAEQLGTWAERSGSEFVRGAEGGDPSGCE